MRKPVIAALALGGFLGAALAAHAISYTGSPYLPLATGVQSYSKTSPTSGTQTFVKGQSLMILLGGTTITSLTVALNPNPYDGQENCIYAKPAVTTLTLSVPAGFTLNDAVTSMSATTRVCYEYSASNLSWDRSL